MLRAAGPQHSFPGLQHDPFGERSNDRRPGGHSGIGGLGHLALQYAKIFGGTVAAIDVTDEKLQLDKDLGADIVIDARTEDPAAVLQSHGGADAAVGLAVDDRSGKAKARLVLQP